MANKTVPEGLKVADYMAAISDPQRSQDCQWIFETMREISGWNPKLWGGTLNSAMVGFGDYHYKYDSGREGDMFRLGFASRAQNISLYVIPGYESLGEELSTLGKHKVGKSCLYIKRIADVDTTVLRTIFERDLEIMAERYPLT